MIFHTLDSLSAVRLQSPNYFKLGWGSVFSAADSPLRNNMLLVGVKMLDAERSPLRGSRAR